MTWKTRSISELKENYLEQKLDEIILSLMDAVDRLSGADPAHSTWS
jgi:hypothetical protein